MVGELLRKRREESGQDLREISKTLRIRYESLKAIEDEEFEKLPAGVYVKGYIREYAELLNIDPEIVINAYLKEVSPPKDEKKEILEKKIAHKKKLKIRYLLIPSLLVLLIITIAFILFPSSREKPRITPSPVETKKEILPPATVETKKEIPLPSVESKKESILEAKNPPHILEVFATETTWLSVNIDNTDAKEMLLKPGESVKLQAKNVFSLKIGNAGGLKLVFDGKEIGEIGEKNQVIKLTLPSD
ncbi:MAG: hypothetical protein COY75_02350 [Nitrospirae bacterium CG_4_10_14_0_8_um_filter_41_23]|nr:DUF4115 domain-containing protein [Nitrospirota bacterium]PIQ93742.1 MAG: hypothetical protein COV68_08100 [Nitrospirae bacterium CG11_big_fil_rev_8_21_14_0_20_41_14]PIV43514.1 MAG: hypothetical protein COS27_04710 [Nitrospirae bacterium CG02_land_8_20_14_3_00_41_53]PIW88155.1 MAG: hypothetical protein COZ94_01110 [Nitrospirae bacterium CG_4_8_14_3_um_filter_41_47]PIY87508.1 MAG: hypothetical protein COY75_02350 [Nitrospirae bacterium CG_4_10_14_0_8_um_filter_41_23]PJA79123.1 MAG: hypotheti